MLIVLVFNSCRVITYEKWDLTQWQEATISFIETGCSINIDEVKLGKEVVKAVEDGRTYNSIRDYTSVALRKKSSLQ